MRVAHLPDRSQTRAARNVRPRPAWDRGAIHPWGPSNQDQREGFSRKARTNQYLEVDLVDVNKPRLFHALPLQPVPQDGKRTSHLGPGHPAHVAPHRHGRVRLDGPVVADVVDLDLGGLDPAAGRARRVGLLDQGRPVRDAAEEVAHVDEVEGVLGPRPGLGAVVDLEAHVGGHPGRLDRGEVRPCYLGGGELVGEVAGALSSVPNVADIRGGQVLTWPRCRSRFPHLELSG